MSNVWHYTRKWVSVFSDFNNSEKKSDATCYLSIKWFSSGTRHFLSIKTYFYRFPARHNRPKHFKHSLQKVEKCEIKLFDNRYKTRYTLFYSKSWQCQSVLLLMLPLMGATMSQPVQQAGGGLVSCQWRGAGKNRQMSLYYAWTASLIQLSWL